MEIILWIGGILFALCIIGSLFNSQCDICETTFNDKSKKYKTKIEGKTLTICARCNRKLAAKKSDVKFDKYFNKNSGNGRPVTSQSRAISSKTKKAVWQRDMGKCAVCGSNEKLEYDHIIPVSKGGSNTMRNVQLLCERCNRSKSNKIQ